jgi:undecaprenyl-diphosphatase
MVESLGAVFFYGEILMADASLISSSQAVLLGLIEGITEFLPVSSTGHLVIADHFLGLRDPARLSSSELGAISAFEIVIQGGAIIAVAWAFLRRVKTMLLGLLGKDPDGLRLVVNLIAAFLPAAVFGLLLHDFIEENLQSAWPVVAALAAGGLAMILYERSSLAQTRRASGFSVDALTWKMAVVIGLAQCVAMWPGTSRSMMTILGGIAIGMNPVAAAEFSFLLGLPTLLAATALKSLKEGHLLVAHVGWSAMTIGLATAALSAFFCVKGLLAWLARYGLAPFGWYRLALAAALLALLR